MIKSCRAIEALVHMMFDYERCVSVFVRKRERVGAGGHALVLLLMLRT